MQTRMPRALAAAAALALFAGACADVPTTAPAARAPGATASRSTSSGPVLISNAVKYRDTGGKPATGRSGSAAVSALALLARDGSTSLEVRAGRADGSAGPAELAHVQVKALVGGAERYVANHHAGLEAPLGLPGLPRGAQVQVQANVRGIDGNRTDVVTVTETVKLRPDLAVTFSAPETVSPGMPVNLTAVVAEINGDVGATATCHLRVDGAVVDQAQGIWVDAGDAVSCAFTHQFPQPGSYTVEVSAAGTAPADWDESNNTVSTSLQVAAPGVAMQYNALVDSRVGYRHSTSTTRYGTGDGIWYEQVSVDTADERLQTLQMLGTSLQPIPGPVTVEVSQTTGGRTLHAAQWTSAGGMPGFWCTSTAQGPTFFFGCSQLFGSFSYTSFLYQRYTGIVTYHGTVYTRTWFDGVMDESVYHYNSQNGWIYEPVQLGDSFQFSVRITAADGTVFQAEADIPLTAGVQEGSTPESCTRYDWSEWSYDEICNSSAFRYEAITGERHWPAAE